jgi:hypothetical protein
MSKPSERLVAQIHRRARWLTLGSFILFGGLWLAVYLLCKGDPHSTSSYYTSLFQIVLILGWCFMVYPFMITSLRLYLYGIDLSEKTADKIVNLHDLADPKKSKLIQHFEETIQREKEWLVERFEGERNSIEERFDGELLDLKEEARKIRAELTRIADSFHRKIETPAVRKIKPIEVPVECQGHGDQDDNGEKSREGDPHEQGKAH